MLRKHPEPTRLLINMPQGETSSPTASSVNQTLMLTASQIDVLQRVWPKIEEQFAYSQECAAQSLELFLLHVLFIHKRHCVGYAKYNNCQYVSLSDNFKSYIKMPQNSNLFS